MGSAHAAGCGQELGNSAALCHGWFKLVLLDAITNPEAASLDNWILSSAQMSCF